MTSPQGPNEPRNDSPNNGGGGLPPNLPEPVIEPRSRWLPSLVWVIPLVAALVGVLLVVKTVAGRGPTITISFVSAEGLEPGKTKLKYKDVDVGTVKTITLSKDHARVLVDVQLTKEASDFAVKDTRFWVVRPRVAASGVSGLSTLLSGAYIGVDAGKSQEDQTQFVGMETPPAVTGDQKGRQFTLHGESLGSIDIGSPVYYRRVPVGQVVGFNLDKDGTGVTMHGLRQCALRPVRRDELALVARERRRPAARFERPQAQHAVARDRRPRRHRVPDTAEPAGRNAGKTGREVPPRFRRSRRDARSRRRGAACRDELQPVVARLVGGRAGGLPRHRARGSDEHRHRIRPEDAKLHDARHAEPVSRPPRQAGARIPAGAGQRRERGIAATPRRAWLARTIAHRQSAHEPVVHRARPLPEGRRRRR